MIAEAMAAGAVIFAAGAVFGRVMPARRKNPKLRKPPEPICGCEHHYSLHDPETKKCHGSVQSSGGRVPVRDEKGRPARDAWGDVVFTSNHELLPCGCRRYTGPEPLPEYYAPEITGGAS